MNKFIIDREDFLQDPVTIITEGLLLGRLSECELLLNHPSVSRVQAGIKQIEGHYYVFSLRPSNPVKLNGKPVEGNQALGSGDVLEVGPFLLDIDVTPDALAIKVSLQIGRTIHQSDVSSPQLGTEKLEDLAQVLAGAKKRAASRPAPVAGTKALDIFWDKRIREAGKMVRPAPLFPRAQKRSGKAQFNWAPTGDLARPWPVSFFIWGAGIVALLSVAGAFWYTNAYAPAPLSKAHATGQLTRFPPIAARANADSCTSCHSLTGSMEANCASCHNAPAFVATVIPAHHDARLGCTTCHGEHRGAEFRPAEAALLTCTQCHNDDNKQTYNGKRVSTPHGGTFGYPVQNEVWSWKGLDQTEWTNRKIAVERLPTDSEQQWRSKQFHALHVERVRAIAGLTGNTQGNLSCSSCHKSFNPIDRLTPRQTCAVCHDGRIEAGTRRAVIASDKPNCTSCHVQHIRDQRHWNPALMAAPPQS
jgi:FHA domain